MFTLIDQPADARDESLADLAWEGACATVLAGEHTAAPAVPATAALTLHAALPDLVMFTPHERALLGDWLSRVIDPEASA
ncbi:hypothetical protein KGQ19_17605 [Catenulispora sp. NL8]|uniref:Uncharacterized protein n=1 Tax=Catenulispora pinistramenti TaxID=2705254 RepID=A0ABS5KRK5_9ACTN|nr:hypothetical protein [Catenulispora pinistramenti]MBS2548688.1 hypothetical protein [Catenulispora pinistramenti]